MHPFAAVVARVRVLCDLIPIPPYCGRPVHMIIVHTLVSVIKFVFVFVIGLAIVLGLVLVFVLRLALGLVFVAAFMRVLVSVCMLVIMRARVRVCICVSRCCTCVGLLPCDHVCVTGLMLGGETERWRDGEMP